ncbi:MAG: hypothetical protein ACYCVB_15380, partial [Bacilli bacterium]
TVIHSRDFTPPPRYGRLEPDALPRRRGPFSRRRAGESAVGGCRFPLAVYRLARLLRDGGEPTMLGSAGPMVWTAGATVWPKPQIVVRKIADQNAPHAQ